MGTPEGYARLKAKNFPHEGGPVILELEVPVEVIAVLEADTLAESAMLSGDACFDPAVGMTELLAAWPTIVKRVIVL